MALCMRSKDVLFHTYSTTKPVETRHRCSQGCADQATAACCADISDIVFMHHAAANNGTLLLENGLLHASDSLECCGKTDKSVCLVTIYCYKPVCVYE